MRGVTFNEIIYFRKGGRGYIMPHVVSPRDLTVRLGGSLLLPGFAIQRRRRQKPVKEEKKLISPNLFYLRFFILRDREERERESEREERRKRIKRVEYIYKESATGAKDDFSLRSCSSRRSLTNHPWLIANAIRPMGFRFI